MNNSFAQFLEGKRLILVAPSGVAEKTLCGDYVDSFDLTVRLGHGFQVKGKERSLGSHTHILYHGLRPTNKKLKISSLDLDLLSSYDINYLCTKSNRCRERVKQLKGRKFSFNHRFASSPKWDFALLGVWAINDLISFNFEALHICGMDFYESGYMENYDERSRCKSSEIRSAVERGHKLAKNAEWIRKAMLKDGRLTCDQTSKEAMERCIECCPKLK
tara:strand:- start:782 stop:1435 length:654 start_codon:yes stop_codon:yes gene_type:complete